MAQKSNSSKGTSEFIGTCLTEGSKREQRDDARVYEKIIWEVDVARKLRGRDEGKTWELGTIAAIAC
jgi:hypothetical protein